jgi:glycosyltransferase involved in cell wall biosynthesis
MISDVFFPRINGVSTSIATFRRQLPEFGVETVLVAPEYGDAEAAEPGVVRLPAGAVPLDPEDRLMSWRALRQLDSRLAGEAFDLVHIHTPFAAHYAGLRLARQRRVPVLATYHTLFEEYLGHYVPLLPRRLLRGLARRFSRQQCNQLDAVVVPSQAMAQRLRDYGVTRPLSILPTGIPLQQFNHGERFLFRLKHGISLERPVALFVGRIAHEKNLEFLLDMLEHARRDCPELLLLFTGEGPASDSLERQVRQRGLQEQVQFLGYLSRQDELPDAYAAADVFVFASRTETQGLVLLEAMAAGLPVVALAAMGTADILTGERGCRIAADDPAAFATTLLTLLNDPPLRAELAQQARDYAQSWSDRAMAERLAALYRQLLAPPCPAAAAAAATTSA